MISICTRMVLNGLRNIFMKNNSLFLLFDKYLDKIPIFFIQNLMGELINRIRWRKYLSSHLPGEQAQLKMAPTFRGAFHHDTDPVHAAVLLLMYPSDNGTLSLVFIKRNEYDGPHSAQISFPGGVWEEGDGHIQNTAIRETREELGIGDDIEILGSLTELHIPVSNYLVSPFVGCMDHTPVFYPDDSEVQFVIESTIKELLDPQNRDSETIFRHGQSIRAPFYLAGEEKIWGATAMMLSEFLQLASMQQ